MEQHDGIRLVEGHTLHPLAGQSTDVGFSTTLRSAFRVQLGYPPHDCWQHATLHWGMLVPSL